MQMNEILRRGSGPEHLANAIPFNHSNDTTWPQEKTTIGQFKSLLLEEMIKMRGSSSFLILYILYVASLNSKSHCGEQQLEMLAEGYHSAFILYNTYVYPYVDVVYIRSKSQIV